MASQIYIMNEQVQHGLLDDAYAYSSYGLFQLIVYLCVGPVRRLLEELPLRDTVYYERTGTSRTIGRRLPPNAVRSSSTQRYTYS
jgi:hypothetical protein